MQAARIKRIRGALAWCVLLALVGGLVLYYFGRSLWVPVYYDLMGRRTVDEVVADIGPQERGQWQNLLRERGLAYPPSKVAFLVSKADTRLEV